MPLSVYRTLGRKRKVNTDSDKRVAAFYALHEVMEVKGVSGFIVGTYFDLEAKRMRPVFCVYRLPEDLSA